MGSTPRIWRNYILGAKYIIKVLQNIQHTLIHLKYNPYNITRNTSWPKILSTYQYFINKPYIKLPMPCCHIIYNIIRFKESTLVYQYIPTNK